MRGRADGDREYRSITIHVYASYAALFTSVPLTNFYWFPLTAYARQPLKAPGLVNTFVCHCSDCRKVSASMFATNFTSLDTHTRFTRGEDNLTVFSQNKTTQTGGTMSNSFCKTCGTLMFRAGSVAPGTKFMRGGIIDDHRLHDTMLKPGVEIFSEHRAGWVKPVDGVEQAKGMGPFGK